MLNVNDIWMSMLNGLPCNNRNKMPHSDDVIAFYLLFMMYLLRRDRRTITGMPIVFLPVQSPLQN